MASSTPINGFIGSLAQESLASRVMDALSNEILSGMLLPGQRVDLSQYAARWDVSITPLRDAAKQLELLGLLKVRPRRGIFVARLTAKEVKDLFDVRIALESEAVRLATPRIPGAEAERARNLYIQAGETADEKQRARQLPEIDLLVHNLALQHCENPRLVTMMEGMRDMVKWCQNTIIQNLEEPFLTTLPEHIAICEAMTAGDAEAAAEAMRVHLTNTSVRIQHFLSSQSSASAGQA